jgi:hypothetical protein
MDEIKNYKSIKDYPIELDEDVILIIQKFGNKYAYKRMGWFDLETESWWVYCERGEEEFNKSSSYTIDQCQITHYCEIPEFK